VQRSNRALRSPCGFQRSCGCSYEPYDASTATCWPVDCQGSVSTGRTMIRSLFSRVTVELLPTKPGGVSKGRKIANSGSIWRHGEMSRHQEYKHPICSVGDAHRAGHGYYAIKWDWQTVERALGMIERNNPLAPRPTLIYIVSFGNPAHARIWMVGRVTQPRKRSMTKGK